MFASHQSALRGRRAAPLLVAAGRGVRRPHHATALLDGYAPIGLLAVLIPGTSGYRPLWLGLGAVALDLLLAVLVASLVRQRLGYRTWRLVHGMAYASWLTAMLHGLGSGSDTRSVWGLSLTAACFAAVTLSVVVRCTDGRADHVAVRGAGALAAIALPIGLLFWLPSGPLGRGCARRAGTPTVLLASNVATAATSAQSTGSAAGGFAVDLRGTERTGPYSDDLAQVHLRLSFDGHAVSYLGVRIIGHPDGRGVAMTTSRVELGSAHHHALYRGQITSLQGSELTAAVVSAKGRRLTISARLAIDHGSQRSADRRDSCRRADGDAYHSRGLRPRREGAGVSLHVLSASTSVAIRVSGVRV